MGKTKAKIALTLGYYYYTVFPRINGQDFFNSVDRNSEDRNFMAMGLAIKLAIHSLISRFGAIKCNFLENRASILRLNVGPVLT